LSPEGKGLSDGILCLAEVAQKLRCSKAQVSNLINGKIRGVPRLKTISIGRRRLVLATTLDDWLLRAQGAEAYPGESLDSTLETHGGIHA
jgi:hypothetical protein